MLEALVPGAALLVPAEAVAPGAVDIAVAFIVCPETWISSPTCVLNWALSPCRVETAPVRLSVSAKTPVAADPLRHPVIVFCPELDPPATAPAGELPDGTP